MCKIQTGNIADKLSFLLYCCSVKKVPCSLSTLQYACMYNICRHVSTYFSKLHLLYKTILRIPFSSRLLFRQDHFLSHEESTMERIKPNPIKNSWLIGLLFSPAFTSFFINCCACFVGLLTQVSATALPSQGDVQEWKLSFTKHSAFFLFVKIKGTKNFLVHMFICLRHSVNSFDSYVLQPRKRGDDDDGVAKK